MFSDLFPVAIWVTDLLSGQDADSSFVWKHSHRVNESGNLFACLCLPVGAVALSHLALVFYTCLVIEFVLKKLLLVSTR